MRERVDPSNLCDELLAKLEKQRQHIHAKTKTTKYYLVNKFIPTKYTL